LALFLPITIDIRYKMYYSLFVRGIDVEWDDDKNETNKREHEEDHFGAPCQ
jgi:hypothetical protein